MIGNWYLISMMRVSWTLDTPHPIILWLTLIRVHCGWIGVLLLRFSAVDYCVGELDRQLMFQVMFLGTMFQVASCTMAD